MSTDQTNSRSGHNPTLAIPLVPEMIHRPDVPAHMMRVRPIARRVTIRLNEETLAESERALRVVEIGHDLYDPVLYIPREDVVAKLLPTAKTTHCPLKGDTTYHDLAASGSRPRIEHIAWIYTRPLPFAEALAGHVAFDAARITVVDAPLQGGA